MTEHTPEGNIDLAKTFLKCRASGTVGAMGATVDTVLNAPTILKQ